MPDEARLIYDTSKVKEFKKLIHVNKCLLCGKKLKNAIDSKTKKLSPYLWKCDCWKKYPKMKNLKLCIG